MKYNTTLCKNALIELSGGTDSALALYKFCKDLPNDNDTNITCITGVKLSSKNFTVLFKGDFENSDEESFRRNCVIRERKDDMGEWQNHLAAERIIAFCQSAFPNITITHKVLDYSIDTLLKNNNKELVDFEHYKKFSFYSEAHKGYIVDCKRIIAKRLIHKVMQHVRFDIRINGLTMNPPINIMHDLDMYDTRMPDRDTAGGTIGGGHRGGVIRYAPWIGIDKKELAKIYNEEDVMDLFMLTESCTNPDNTVSPPEPCKECWWCKEKYFGFGTYDYGIK